MSSKLHIQRIGSGPALVLIHGWALHSGVFNALAQRLSKHFELFMVDLPGHGLSRHHTTTLQLTGLTKAIAHVTPPAIWCGWSLGGLLALQAARFLPQVRGLIMLAATPCFVRTKQWPNAMDSAVFDDFRNSLSPNTSRTLERFLALNVKGSRTARTSLRYLHQVLAQTEYPNFNTLNQGLDWLQHSDLRPLLPQLAVPSLWIGGKNDCLIPELSIYEAIALEECAISHVHMLPGCSHVPFIDQPATVAQLICDFVYAPTV